MPAVQFWVWFAFVLLLVALALFTVGLRRRADTHRIYCPGKRRRLGAWLNPLRWVFRAGCWYNLTGLPEGEHRAVRCPECGTVTRPTERLLGGGHWRPHVVGTLCVALAAGSIGAARVQAGSWLPLVPTPFLIAVEYVGPDWQPRDLRSELYDRTTARSITGYSARVLARSLAGDLRDDGRRWNAHRASDMLGGLWPDSRAALESVLTTGDRQARLIAASILRAHVVSDPSDALLTACVEDLRHDVVPADSWTYWNASCAAEYLCRFPLRIEPFLEPALQSDDWQQRLLAASVAGFSNRIALLDRAAPILIEQLRDDDIRGNAKIAAPPLYRFGTGVIPYLEPYCDDDDWQLRALAQEIIDRLRHAEGDGGEFDVRIPWITETTDDPLANLSVSSGIRDLRSHGAPVE